MRWSDRAEHRWVTVSEITAPTANATPKFRSSQDARQEVGRIQFARRLCIDTASAIRRLAGLSGRGGEQ